LFADAKEDISLGTLVPTQEQILVAQIQEQLRKARLYNGPQDGIAGSGTVRAIRTYQRQNDIPANGVADQDLLTFMLQQGTMD
jgi:peptidoglycan hydrolase-like protein with peptidoglycan-binding domain